MYPAAVMAVVEAVGADGHLEEAVEVAMEVAMEVATEVAVVAAK